MATKRSDLDVLQTTKTQADLHDLLPQELKPCVALMLEEGPPGGELNPNTTCYIIATEFRRLGKPEEDALAELREWAVRAGARGRALRPREVEKTVASAYAGTLMTYGCGTNAILYRSGHCVGHKACPYYSRIGNRQKPNEQDFCRFGWPAIVGANAASIYHAVAYLEHERGAPGGTTYVSYRDLRHRSGASLSWMKKGLQNLSDAGLITFSPGQQGAAHGKATEIKRVLPIPEPPPPLISD